MQKTFTKKVKEEIEKHIEKKETIDLVKMSYDKVVVKKDLRAKFIRYGSISDPEKGHHLEYSFKNHDIANITIKELSLYGIAAKLSVNKRGNRYRVYVLEESTIMEVLRLLGAISLYKEYKKVADYKKTIKGTQAKVNFETANISKSVKAGLSQIEDIEKLLKAKKMENLDEGLQQVIRMRKKYPDMSLTELAEKIGNISKSALNHRFIKIRKMVKEL